jgi:hypothetical protein
VRFSTRQAAAIVVAAGAMFGPVMFTAPAHAGVVGCSANVLNVAPRDTVNCYSDTAGFCVFYYDPVEDFPRTTVSETTWFANCLAL